MLKHIVMWKLKPLNGSHEDAIRTAKAALESCAMSTPGMLKYEVGTDIAVDAGGPWDIVLYSEFSDRAALQVYQDSPGHQEIKKVLGPLRDMRACVDYES
jgi:quinol monooxygenase YgiN